MHSVAAIFPSWTDAERAAKTLNAPEHRISLIAPAPRKPEDADIGQALGGVLGGSIGLAVGSSAGSAVASLAIPGVGPIIATGTIAGLLLGAGGVAVGTRMGEKLDRTNAQDPAHDPFDRFFYHEALRRGRTILIVLAETPGEAIVMKALLAKSGARDLEETREDWWNDLRSGEEDQYDGNFVSDELEYQRGFEKALTPEHRGTGDAGGEASVAYRKGYERGQEYFRKLYEHADAQ